MRRRFATLFLALLVAAPPAGTRAAGAVASVVTPQEHGEPAAAGGAGVDEGDAEEGHAEEWGTDAMMHHIVDARELELFGQKISLEPLSVPPVHVAGLEIDVSPTKHVVFLWLASLLTVLTVWLAARRSARTDHGREAPRGILNLFESFYVYLRDDVALANIGHGGERYVPYVVTLFFFILYANLLGLVPGGATATSNIMVTGALALISLAIVEASGFAALGPKGYLGTIFYVPKGLHPVMQAVMLVIMTPVELIGKLAKPFALAVRLFANMTAGHFVILALLGLILTFGSFTRATGLAAIGGSLLLGLFVMFLEIFVASLQAYIFTALTAVFIGLIRHAH
ncbi:MAG: F0F1 ATP synthase subunit A [Gemmatimonadota bacterium]|nr:F0F1 ATP synthase subunit A [Gemmatimonadota bacterium]